MKITSNESSTLELLSFLFQFIATVDFTFHYNWSEQLRDIILHGKGRY